MVKKLNLIFTLVFIGLLVACNIPKNPSNESGNTENKHIQKIHFIKQKQWKREQALNVLCATGNAICSNGGQAVCYTDLTEFEPYEFERVARNSLPVCEKNNQITSIIPACQSEKQPVCGLGYDISADITDTVAVCEPIGGYKAVVCPFGGKPVCVKELIYPIKVETAYCVNDKNELLSGNNFEFHLPVRIAIIRGKNLIGCRDGKSIPKCFGGKSDEEELENWEGQAVQENEAVEI